MCAHIQGSSARQQSPERWKTLYAATNSTSSCWPLNGVLEGDTEKEAKAYPYLVQIASGLRGSRSVTTANTATTQDALRRTLRTKDNKFKYKVKAFNDPLGEANTSYSCNAALVSDQMCRPVSEDRTPFKVYPIHFYFLPPKLHQCQGNGSSLALGV